jgi:hypothetical protein
MRIIAAVLVVAVVLVARAPGVHADTLRVVSFNLFHGGPASGLFGDGHHHYGVLAELEIEP